MSWCKKIKGARTLISPPLRSADTGLIGLPGGNISAWGVKHVCSKGGAASSKCFTTRASTGDNNMTLEIPVLDFLGIFPFSSATGGEKDKDGNETIKTNPLKRIALTNVFPASVLDNFK